MPCSLDSAFLADLQRRGLITGTFVRLNPTRRDAIVAAILEEAALKGPTLLNIKEVARRANVSIGSLYQYFTLRQGLFDFSVEIITRQMISAFAVFKPYLAELPLSEALRAYFQGGTEMEPQYQGYIRYFARAAYQGDPDLMERVVRPVAAAMLEMTQAILEAARSRAEIRPDIDFEAVSRLINTLLIAVYDARFLPNLNTYYQLSGPAVSPQRILDNMLIFIHNALQP
jgi:AcrR family transcriptional regulator